MMWVDTFFRPHCVHNPGVMGNARLNCTVMEVLHVPSLRPSLGMPAFSTWNTMMERMVGSIVIHWDRLLAVIERLNSSCTAGRLQPEVRVPLDVHRTGVRSLQ